MAKELQNQINKTRNSVVAIVSLLIGIVCAFGVLVEINNKFIVTSIIYGIMAIISVVISFIEILKPRKIMLFSSINVISISILLLFNVYIGSSNGFSPLWFIILPELTFFFMKIKQRLIFSIVIGILLIITMVDPLDMGYDYESSFIFRTAGLYICALLLVGAIEIIKIQANKQYDDQHETLVYLASYDILTNVYNRTSFNRIFKEKIDSAKSNNENMSVIILDIDFFKRVNDKYGHINGDNVLKQLASTIKSSFKKTDLVFRWGGEEFAIILPNCNIDEAQKIAERIRLVIAEKEMILDGYDPINITISLGVAEVNATDIQNEGLNKADIALYHAKETGRNRVCTYNEMINLKGK